MLLAGNTKLCGKYQVVKYFGCNHFPTACVAWLVTHFEWNM